jgi:HEAT repeat protein
VRRRAVVVAGHTGQETVARGALHDPSPGARASALSALARMGSLQAHDIIRAMADPQEEVRRRACEVAGRRGRADLGPEMAMLLGELVIVLTDKAASVVEVACYALGELGGGEQPAAAALSTVATGHGDPLCREAAVAALGALGQPDGLAAVLSALGDKAAVRRRAVIALAGFEDAFDGDEVQGALRKAVNDPDWQVRQGAEDVLGQRTRPGPRPSPPRPAQTPLAQTPPAQTPPAQTGQAQTGPA